MKNNQQKQSINKQQKPGSNQQTQSQNQKQSAFSSYSKVKPVVVKHVLKDQIAPIADPRFLNIQGKESVRLSEVSMSPRFYGQGQPPYFGKPEEISRDLINTLEKGMTHLKSNYRKENQDPQQLSQFLWQQRHADQTKFNNQIPQQQQYTSGYPSATAFNQQYESYGVDGIMKNGFQSKSNIESAMTMDDLDKLRSQNEDRIRLIEEKYFKKKEESRQVREIFQEKAELREPKEKHVDSSLSYPTYGRGGVDPDPNINTYMINKHLCHDGGSPSKKIRIDTDDNGSPNREEKAKRPKIISPRRQKFETQFEKFMVHKYVDEKVKPVEQPEKKKDDVKFDTITKLEGSLNAKVVQKQLEEQMKTKLKQEIRRSKNKSLCQIENNVEKLLNEEALVVLEKYYINTFKMFYNNIINQVLLFLGQEVLDKFRQIFNQVMEEQEPNPENPLPQDHVDFNYLIGTIAEDEYFQNFMGEVARKTIDGETESFEDLLNRVLTEYKEESISWIQFLGFFSKRGKLQGYNQIQLSPTRGKGLTANGANDEQGGNQLQENIQQKFIKQQAMVPKEGKGKYNVTLPQPYEFEQRGKSREKTIREQKLDQMLKDKENNDLQYKSYVFRANDIPRTTKEPLFEKLIKNKEERRLEVKRLSMALTKQNEKPFSFYTRDQSKNRDGVSGGDIPETMKHPPFRANKILNYNESYNFQYSLESIGSFIQEND